MLRNEQNKPAAAKAPRLSKRTIAQSTAFVEMWLDRHFHHNIIPGLSFSLHKDGKPLISRQWGHADTENQIPLTGQHIFRAASIAKIFTAAATGILADEGKLDIEDRIVKHLPWLKENKAMRHIRIRHLLSHTGGIAREGGIAADYWNMNVPFPDRAQLQDVTKDMTPVFNRTGKLKYSNWGYALLGEVIAQAAQQSYDDLIRSRIIDPAGLTSTFTDAPQVAADRTTASHLYTGTRTPRTIETYVSTASFAPATGLCSTADDLCHFLHAFNHGLVSDDMKSFLITPLHKIDGDPELLIGHGFMTSGNDEYAITGHGGFFSGQMTAAYMHPPSGVTISACSNTQSVDAVSLVENAWATFRFFHENERALNTEHARTVSGRYTNTLDDLHVLATTKVAAILDLAEEALWGNADILTSDDGGIHYLDANAGEMEHEAEPSTFTVEQGTVRLRHQSITLRKTLDFS